MFNPQTNFPQTKFPVSSNFPQTANQIQFPVSSNFPQTSNQIQFPVSSNFPQTSNQIQFPVSSNFPQTSSNNLQTTSFPNSSNSINNLQTSNQTHVTFENLNNVYSLIEKQFLNMKKLSIFSESQDMKPSDLETINSISADSIEKLGEVSIIYIKNNNSKTKLNSIFEKHLELITKIIKFNNVYSEISLNIKQLASIELTEDEKRFTFVDIFYRYKLQLYEIISDINMLIAYKTLI
jgi:hypothetical protein